MTFHSFSMYGFCRLMLTLEQVITADHNTVEGFLIVQIFFWGGGGLKKYFGEIAVNKFWIECSQVNV